jgi:GTP-binding protein
MITRDRKYYRTDWNGKVFYLMDTGGIDLKSKQRMDVQVVMQAKKAIDESDIIIFLVDLREPVSLLDDEIASMLRKTDKDIVFVGNKFDDKKSSFYIEDYLKFGFGYPIKISAMHGINTGDLLDEIVPRFKKDTESTSGYSEKKIPGICILGKPNAGKSTLFNSMINEERAIVDEVEGTTRDSIDIILNIGGRSYRFIDTAGLKRGKIKEKDLDFYSEIRTIKSIESSDICLIVIDCTSGITVEDLKIIEICIKKGVSICIIFNKIDLVDKNTVSDIVKTLNMKVKFANYIPFLSVSALTKKGIKNIMDMIDELIGEREKRIKDSEINSLFKELDQREEGVYIKGKKFRIKFIRQLKTSPPYFLVFSNMDAAKRINIKRYVENNIREKFGFKGTPVFFKFKY